VDGVKGKLHVIWQDVDMEEPGVEAHQTWLANIDLIMHAALNARLAAQLAFYEYLELREASDGGVAVRVVEPVPEPVGDNER
jgi:hypothetical protein